jgi:uncharacterized membrane protein
MNDPGVTTRRLPDAGLISYTNWIYALHALSVLIGLLTFASVATKFVFGLPSIVAVVMNYARRNDARDSFLLSHFNWQIRTFWFSLLWVVVVSVVSAPLILALGLGLLTMSVGFTIIGIWIIYRVVRGWSALRDGKPIAAMT